MTSDQFNDRLAVIGWPLREVSRRLSVPTVRVQRWGAGQYPVPDDVATWLEKLARAVEAVPVPDVGRGRAAR